MSFIQYPDGSVGSVSPGIDIAREAERTGGIVVDFHPGVQPLGYTVELAGLNTAYQADIDSLNKAFTTASIVQGASMPTKQAAIRDQFNARKSQYLAEYSALRAQYGV